MDAPNLFQVVCFRFEESQKSLIAASAGGFDAALEIFLEVFAMQSGEFGCTGTISVHVGHS
jgi:hypothetical protein